MAELSWPGGLAYIENEKPFVKRLAVRAAPTGRDALEPRDHLAFGDLDLDRPSVFRPGNKSAKLRRGRIGDIKHAPTAMPEVRDVEIPAVVHFLHCQLESRLVV